MTTYVVDFDIGDQDTPRAPRVDAQPEPFIWPCGCSRRKIALGMCDLYHPSGAPRADNTTLRLHHINR